MLYNSFFTYLNPFPSLWLQNKFPLPQDTITTGWSTQIPPFSDHHQHSSPGTPSGEMHPPAVTSPNGLPAKTLANKSPYESSTAQNMGTQRVFSVKIINPLMVYFMKVKSQQWFLNSALLLRTTITSSGINFVHFFSMFTFQYYLSYISSWERQALSLTLFLCIPLPQILSWDTLPCILCPRGNVSIHSETQIHSW